MRKLLGLIVMSGCTVGVGDAPVTAMTTLQPRSNSTVGGVAMFTATSTTFASMTLEVFGATPGSHGVHLHAVGDCSAPDATSAMGHWDPGGEPHGHPGSGESHIGDCGNIVVGADGTGRLTVIREWAVGTGEAHDVMGHALIVHEKSDDYQTQTPPGNAGARQACGVVGVVLP